MNNKKILTGLKIGSMVLTFGLTILSSWVDKKEQQNEIRNAVQEYLNDQNNK